MSYFLKKANGDEIKEITELTGESDIFSLRESGQLPALFVINGDGGIATIWQKIRGESVFRVLRAIDLSIEQGNHEENRAVDRAILYKITYTDAVNMSIHIGRIVEEN